MPRGPVREEISVMAHDNGRDRMGAPSCMPTSSAEPVEPPVLEYSIDATEIPF
jgi:hypothetical protein